MRTNQLIYEKVVGDAKLGLVKDLSHSVTKLQLGQLIPYIAKQEDVEIVYNFSTFLRDNQPLEFNGYITRQISSGFNPVQGTLFDDVLTYQKFIKNHPALMSFPSELIWLANSDGLNHFKNTISWILQKKHFALDKANAEKRCHRI